jgi:hypothetical protein
MIRLPCTITLHRFPIICKLCTIGRLLDYRVNVVYSIMFVSREGGVDHAHCQIIEISITCSFQQMASPRRRIVLISTSMYVVHLRSTVYKNILGLVLCGVRTQWKARELVERVYKYFPSENKSYLCRSLYLLRRLVGVVLWRVTTMYFRSRESTSCVLANFLLGHQATTQKHTTK